MSTDPNPADAAQEAQDAGAGQDPSNTPIDQLVTNLDPDDDVLHDIHGIQASLGTGDATA